jgi:hypothetical protein
MHRWIIGLAILLVACSQTTAKPAVNSPVAPSPSAISNPSQSPTPIPPLVGDLPVTTLSFSCRLPVYLQTGYEGSPDFSRRGGFITFPSASIEMASGGQGGGYFDRAFNRWLPVTRESVSPDGTHYAQIDTGSELLRIVDVASGKDRSFPLSSINANVVFDYSTDGVYMTFGFEGLHGMWLIDPVTGSSHEVSGVSSPEASGGGGIFWVGEVNPADPHPIVTGASVGIGGTLANQVTRVDVKSGARTQWLYRPGTGIGVVALDVRGHPLINLVESWGAKTGEILIAPDAKSQRSIYKGPVVGTLGGAIADSHGVWFGSAHGIYLYSESGGLQKVSNQPGYPANGCF